MKKAAVGLAALAVAGGVYLALPEDEPRNPPAAAPAIEAPPAPQAAAAPAPTPSSAEASLEPWSDTEPAVNQAHIFLGDLNRRGKPVGFHSRPAGKNPKTARLVRIIDRPNRAGVYTADVEILDENGRWKKKRSTMYPDRLSREQVIAAVLHAWNERESLRQGKFRGPSGEGFTIEGYLLEPGERINTAYPIFNQAQ
ncbi:MAG TPA: EndoU domain-containing protein [Thermoanaerobaculia bacterium]|nr:EndoU domain-containing protein [Thermoanaerobaculia bacterium]